LVIVKLCFAGRRFQNLGTFAVNRQRPIENSYWVVPGKFLAGEYPGSRYEAAANAKLKALIDAGITCFMDLTEAHEGLAAYHHLVAPIGGARVSVRRCSIPDMSVPPSRHFVVEILYHIDRVLHGGGCVYLHCWGGVGRTGTIVGCWLAGHGYPGRAALERLEALWSHCAKSSWHRSPETAEQVDFIINWDESGLL
jgi:hypothetical protein